MSLYKILLLAACAHGLLAFCISPNARAQTITHVPLYTFHGDSGR